MFFLVARVIIIILLLITIYPFEESFLMILFHTFVQICVMFISFAGVFISYLNNQKQWPWIFGFIIILYYVILTQNMVTNSALLYSYTNVITIALYIASFIFVIAVPEHKYLFLINECFYPMIISLIIITVSYSGINYRWERVEQLNFCIDDHQYVIEGDFYSYCDDLRDCGWEYYKDRYTGLDKAVFDEYEDPLVIYGKPALHTIDTVIDIGIMFIGISAFVSTYYFFYKKFQ